MNKVLVLGSHGLIGKALVEKLQNENIECVSHDLKMGPDYDLVSADSGREKGILSLNLHEVDFVYFLAYDVGGSKYLEEKQSNFDFISNNIKIMDNVFRALKLHKKPFVFASSMMAEMSHSSYGNLKRLGESYTKTLDAVSARFWNVYGVEEHGHKSHLVPDLINNYYRQVQFLQLPTSTETNCCSEIPIKLRTDGSELRQFISSKKAAEALCLIMRNYKDRKKFFLEKEDSSIVDVSNGEWIDINKMSNLTLKTAKKVLEECLKNSTGDVPEPKIIKGDRKDFAQFDTKVEPNLLPIIKMGFNPYENIDDSLQEVASKIMGEIF